jgi:mycofactocin precursor
MSETELLDPPADEITDAQPAPAEDEATDVPALAETSADLLVEEISIDGMCGVY